MRVLETERLILRSYEYSDVPELVRPNTFAGAYASAVNHGRGHLKQGHSSIPSGGNDFQLEGR